MDPVNSVTGDDSDSVDSVTGDNTTKPAYWLNFRFLLCGLCILVAIVESLVLIWKYEGYRKSRNGAQDESQEETAGSVCKEDTWKTCYKSLHPGFLLTYRLIAFCVLLSLITSDGVVNSAGIFFFYTQWTFTLVTSYFALALVLSVYGCCHGSETMCNGEADIDVRDPEIGTNVFHNRRIAGFWGYAFQILYQTCAGAITLTDIVFWFILYKDIKPNFLVVCMHSVNAVCYLGDLVLNNLKFPFFRIAYFQLWTCTFVVFQWIFHACLSTDWPYPFLDLSSNNAPFWYFGLWLLHLPCFGVIALVMKAKKCWLSRSQAESYSSVT